MLKSVLAWFALQTLYGNASSLHAGENVNVRGMGMARTSVADARGLDAVGINPANLSLLGREIMTFSVLPITGFLSADFLTYDIYSKYLQNGSELSALSQSSKEEVLSAFDGPVGNGRVEATARLFGMTLRIDSTKSIAFTVDYGFVGAGTFPREYARFLLDGNLPGSTFRIDGVAAEVYWHRTYELSYGMPLPTPAFLQSLSFGVGVKFVEGYGYFSLNKLTTTLVTNSSGMISGDVSMLARRVNTDGLSDPLKDFFQTSAGYGVGLDVGFTASLSENLTFGLSVTDIGSIRWTREIEEMSLDSTVTTADPSVLTNVRSLANSTRNGRRSIGEFSTRLPGLVRFGLAARIDRLLGAGNHDELLAAIEYSQGIGASAPLKGQPRISFGVEYKPTSWLPIRGGLAVTGSSSAHVALGLGLIFRSMRLDIATEDISLFLRGRSSSTGSLGMAVKILVH
ncbi:MAG: hypothetical protein HY961_15600 [Ignavibacteriae bacterium]|nr:hypothetical protein [Ignavibacteriota bacterium]